MREAKKSESIEVRLPHDRKRDFMAHCRAGGRSASEAIRGFIDAELAGVPRRRPVRLKPIAAGGLAAVVALGLGMVVAPGGVAAAPDFRPGFDSRDRNHDGVLSLDEFGVKAAIGRPCAEGVVFVLPLARATTPGAKGTRPFAINVADFSFAQADWDHDGRVTPDEYAANWTRVLRAGFAALDADGDGRIDPEEYRATARHAYQGPKPDIASFAELDRNRDGRIGWDEFTV